MDIKRAFKKAAEWLGYILATAFMFYLIMPSD
jgi:hypothetical protein